MAPRASCAATTASRTRIFCRASQSLWQSCSNRTPPASTLGIFDLNELPAEASLDAEVSAGYELIERRRDLDDRVVLGVHGQGAADAAVGADRVGERLAGLVPGPRAAHGELGLERERARRADPDAVAAVDAGRVGERHGVLGRDARVEAAPGDGDGEGVLRVAAAGLDAVLAADARSVVAHVEA